MAIESDYITWGVLCDSCGLLPIVRDTRHEARDVEREHRGYHEHPKPAVRAVRVRVMLEEAPDGR